MKSFDPNFTDEPFLCPECGGDKAYLAKHVSIEFVPDDPVTHILEWIECKQCHSDIPAHIAERWNGLTVEQAKQEWRELYRDEDVNTRFDEAVERFNSKFGFLPFFDGMSMEQMKEGAFIELINQAVDNNDPDIDLTDYFPDGRNL
ncbi:MAG: hypothetical protein IBX57_11675 [Gammaproteobacteria bacterium]|nr:hypothetical protein [Gammaproteobacteria bacterium]